MTCNFCYSQIVTMSQFREKKSLLFSKSQIFIPGSKMACGTLAKFSPIFLGIKWPTHTLEYRMRSTHVIKYELRYKMSKYYCLYLHTIPKQWKKVHNSIERDKKTSCWMKFASSLQRSCWHLRFKSCQI